MIKEERKHIFTTKGKLEPLLVNLNMCRSCCSSESPGKSACFVTSSATIQMEHTVKTNGAILTIQKTISSA